MSKAVAGQFSFFIFQCRAKRLQSGWPVASFSGLVKEKLAACTSTQSTHHFVMFCGWFKTSMHFKVNTAGLEILEILTFPFRDAGSLHPTPWFLQLGRRGLHKADPPRQPPHFSAVKVAERILRHTTCWVKASNVALTPKRAGLL